MLRLVELSLEMETQFRSFLDQLERQGQAGQWLFEYEKDPFDVFVKRLENWKSGKDLPDGWVPSSTLWLTDESGRILGKSSLRHDLNDFLRNIGGHIGYNIRKSERRKGYGSKILQLTLAKAKKLGLERVLITCDDNNIASAKIIEKNGGVFNDTYQDDTMTLPKRRYWIELKQGANNGSH